ncbi:MAG: hypothetical protein IJV05_06975 [Muribaculaceae bacterium]|nr:hypothetical protein [Muribaculaceae bacterium]
MKYRVFALLGALALGAGAILQAQDYDDIYYDASKSTTTQATTSKAKPAKTVAVYGEVPDRYATAARSNYRLERDEDEYNRRGTVAVQPSFEVDINGDTIYFDNDSIYDDDAFANTRRIERFYNPDIVLLSTDDQLVELYYDESPTINLIVGSDWSYASYGWSSWHDPWWYNSWYSGWYWNRWYDPWYSPFYYGYRSPYWHWGWHYSPWYRTGWGWDYAWHGWHGNTYWNTRPAGGRHHGTNYNWTTGTSAHRAGLGTNRNGRTPSGVNLGSRSGMTSRGTGTNRGSGIGTRPGTGTTRNNGNMGTRQGSPSTRSGSGTSGVRSSSTTRSYSGGSSSYGGSRSSYGSSRSSSGLSYGGSRGSYNSGSRSSSSSSSSYGGSRSSSGSYGGSHSSGGGSHGGSAGGGGRRR